MHHDVDKRRIGLILPSVNIRMEPELNRCPQLNGFNFYATRVLLDDTTEDTLRAMEQDLKHAADMLATVSRRLWFMDAPAAASLAGPTEIAGSLIPYSKPAIALSLPLLRPWSIRFARSELKK